jgi:hypothetical protein
MKNLCFLGLALLILGCGSTTPPTTPEAKLELQEWQKMPKEIKYDIDTLERLRRSDVKYQNQREWDRFSREVILAERKKDGLK